jgi:hypothetical protein
VLLQMNGMLRASLFFIVAFRVEAVEVWMIPPADNNGQSLRDLTANPKQWSDTRAHVDVLGYADHLLNKQFTDEELRKVLLQLDKLNLKLGLEVGAIKPWGVTADKTFAADRQTWNRVVSLGGKVYAIAMDEPLSATHNDLHKDSDYAAAETAKFIALVRKSYPNIIIGDIEPYPSLQTTELLVFIDALQNNLAQMNVRGLEFFRLDVDWVHFVKGNAPHGSWPEVRDIELECRKRQIPFGLIYWAADYPELRSHGLADDSTWYVSIIQQGYDYALVGGAPDQFVIESWISAPAHILPETTDWTFTRSVRDFTQRFVRHQGGKSTSPHFQ